MRDDARGDHGRGITMKLSHGRPGVALAAVVALSASLACGSLRAADTPAASCSAPGAPPAGYDAELARATGADEQGMRKYVLVILKSSSTPMPAGPARDAMFKGHFANMQRLAADGKLVLAGPLDKVDGWRGLFVFAVEDIEEAKKLVATDPVVAQGEMVAEYHRYFGSAALMLVNDWHGRLTKPQS
jgi:uncharacterized protein YciI